MPSFLLAAVALIIGHRSRGAAPPPQTLMIDVTPPSTWRHSATDDFGALIWPDDPDDVPAWRLEREAWAAREGVRLPSYRTRREAQQHQDRASAAPMMPVVNVSTVLSVDDAAAQFLAHLRKDDLVGEYSAAEITDLYKEFCAAGNHKPSPVDHVKAALAALPGVYREVQDQRIDGRRRRVMRWIIEPADLRTLEETFAFPAEEYRQAA